MSKHLNEQPEVEKHLEGCYQKVLSDYDLEEHKESRMKIYVMMQVKDRYETPLYLINQFLDKKFIGS